MKPIIFTKRFVKCLNCGTHEFSIEHLFEPPLVAPDGTTRKAGPWYCDDCGAGWYLECSQTNLVAMTPSRDRVIRRRVRLEIPPQTETIVIFTEGSRWENAMTGESVGGNDEYFYEEHTCPSNYFRGTIAVHLGEDSDPHGLAKYVSSEDIPYE